MAKNSRVSQAKRNKSGGYSRGVPPLPIPNREVKPTRADGTAPQCGRVGRRRLYFLRFLDTVESIDIQWIERNNKKKFVILDFIANFA